MKIFTGHRKDQAWWLRTGPGAMEAEEAVRILAMEVENKMMPANGIEPLLRDEAGKVWEFYQDDFIREIYFRADQNTAVLILESTSVEEARERLAALPLVAAGWIDFDIVPLIPYPGFSRLFSA